MIQIDLSKLQQFVSVPYEMELAPRLHIVHGHLQKGNGVGGEFTGWVHLPESYDRAEFARIEQAAQKIRSDSQALVVIGIGGSYLGARGVIECLCSPNYNLKKKDTPNIYFIGNGLSSDQLSETMELLDGVDFSVNVISKSGTTTEPAVAFRFFRRLLEERYGKEGAAARIYATTDRHKGALKSLADANGYETFVVPDDIGGRAMSSIRTGRRSSCSPRSSRRSASWPSGGSSSTASPKARRARASSRRASSSRRTCTPWGSISSRASGTCLRRSCASARPRTKTPSPMTTEMATG